MKMSPSSREWFDHWKFNFSTLNMCFNFVSKNIFKQLSFGMLCLFQQAARKKEKKEVINKTCTHK